MPPFERCNIRTMAAADIPAVLAWRNHPDIRRYMMTQHEITLDEHQAWFEGASQDATRRLLIVEERQVALGFVHFSDVSEGGVCNWGFYVAPGAPRGSGTKLGATALDFAFGQLALHKVCGQALDYNDASIRMHGKLGFRKEGNLREHHRIGAAYHALICFGLLRREWL